MISIKARTGAEGRKLLLLVAVAVSRGRENMTRRKKNGFTFGEKIVQV